MSNHNVTGLIPHCTLDSGGTDGCMERATPEQQRGQAVLGRGHVYRRGLQRGEEPSDTGMEVEGFTSPVGL